MTNTIEITDAAIANALNLHPGVYAGTRCGDKITLESGMTLKTVHGVRGMVECRVQVTHGRKVIARY